MTITSRPYTGDADRDRLVAFVAAVAAGPTAPGYYHVGDVLWGLYQNTVFDPHQQIRLWEDGDGRLLGFAWFAPPRTLSMQTDLGRPERGEIEAEMLNWADQRWRALADATDPPLPLVTHAFADDAARRALLAREGFVAAETAFLYMHRCLDASVAAAPPSDRATVRPVAGEAELTARVDLHREVWQPSRVTLDAYRQLRAAPGYCPDLDLVAVAPDGALAAYCICWFDPVSWRGEFEPVGTRAAYRRQGYGRAVMLAGLRRLWEHGATDAYVYALGANEPAVKLYEAVGFRAVRVDQAQVRSS